MNAPPPILIARPRSRGGATLLFALLSAVLLPQSAHASIFHGETLDAVANGISWVAIIIAPIIGIVLRLASENLAAKIELTRIRASRLRERVNLYLALGGDFKGTDTFAK